MTKDQKIQALRDAIAITKEYGKCGAERLPDTAFIIEESYNKIVEIMEKIEKE